MFKANEILTALKALLESGLSPALKVSVQFDEYLNFSANDFAGGTSIVVISALTDAPVNQDEGFANGHYRTLSVRFELRALGFPVQLTVEPIAKAVADLIYGEQRKLTLGTSALQGLVTSIGIPTLGYDGMQADVSFAGAALDIPISYFSTYPIS